MAGSLRRAPSATSLALRIALAWCAGQGASCGGAPAAEPGSRPPNIVLILADDLGYQDLGCNWTPTDAPQHARIETPHIDRLAAEGVRFTSFCTGDSICTPSRAALLTGCYPARVGMSFPPDRHGVLRALTTEGLHPDEVTLAELLGERGYATICIGKWHLGTRTDFLPTRQGFDEHYGPASRGKNKPVRMLRDTRTVETVAHREITARYTEEAIRFMTANRERPFFVYLSHGMPHVPLDVREAFRGRSARGLYGDVVTELDWSTGELLAALARLGLEDDTLVIFSSDNGPADFLGPEGGSAFPLRGGKASAYEGGFRVPFVARWPGHIPAGTVCDELATAMDLLPTLCRLAGQDVPGDRSIDGRDIGPLLRGEPGATTPHGSFAYYRRGSLEALRGGPWKLHFDAQGAPAALYHLGRDPGEERDARAQHPDVVERLVAGADAVRLELGDARAGLEGRSTRPVGHSEGPSIQSAAEDE